MKKIALIILLPILFFSCKEEIYSTIPNAPVSVKLDLNFEDMNLNAALAYSCFSEKRKESDRIGYGGILVINGWGISPVNLYAYDMACPVEASRSAIVVPDDEGYCTCNKCGSRYNIAIGDGRPESGAALELEYFLRSYRVVETGTNTYLVTN